MSKRKGLLDTLIEAKEAVEKSMASSLPAPASPSARPTPSTSRPTPSAPKPLRELGRP